MKQNNKESLEIYKETGEYKRLNTELGMDAKLVGDETKCVCKDCKFRLKCPNDITDKDVRDRFDHISITKIVCEKFNKNMPVGMKRKPYGIVENNEQCDLYERA